MKKPEWFEIADNDRPTAPSAKHRGSALAVIATLAVTSLASWGFLTSDQEIASATVTQAAPEVSTVSTSSVSPVEEILPPAANTRDDDDYEDEDEDHELGDDD